MSRECKRRKTAIMWQALALFALITGVVYDYALAPMLDDERWQKLAHLVGVALIEIGFDGYIAAVFYSWGIQRAWRDAHENELAGGATVGGWMPTRHLADALFEHLRHGEPKHQEWLRREVDRFFKRELGRFVRVAETPPPPPPMPPQPPGDGVLEAQAKALPPVP